MQDKGKVGWVPAAYLQKCSKVSENGDDDEDTSNYLGFVVEGKEYKQDILHKQLIPVSAYDYNYCYNNLI